jgi:dienelactone hydrolase
MTDILIFPSVLGVHAGVTATAEHLRAAGHRVEVVDLLDGRTFDSYEPAMAHRQSLDGEALEAEALRRSRVVDGPFVAVGFSAGGALAQHVALRRPEDARGVAVMGSAMPLQWVGGGEWPSGVPVQEHVGEEDAFDDGPEVRAEFTTDMKRAGVEPEFFTYPGAGHLFNEPMLTAEHDAEAADLFHARLLAFVEG